MTAADRPYTSAAAVYDLLYAATGKDYAAEAAAVAELVRSRVPAARTLLDVACGTGGHLAPLAEQFEAEGLDASPEMVAVARGRGLAVRVADMRTFRLARRFDAVVCLFSAIGYMVTVADLRKALATMADHVAPGGILVVEAWVHRDQWRDASPVSVTVAQDPGRSVVRMDSGRRDADVTTLDLHYLIGGTGGITHVRERHELALFTEQQYREAFQRAGVVQVTIDRGALTGRGLYAGLLPADPR